MNSLISVIIPYYNNSKTLYRCLSSIINQSYKNLEIIIVNDGSNDWLKAENIIDSFDDLRIKVKHHLTNINGSAARNSGVRISRGEYIAFLDSDDEWYSFHLEKCMLKYEQLSKKNVVLFCGLRIITGSPEQPITTTFEPNQVLENKDISEYLFVDNQIISTCSIFTTRIVALNYPFNEELKRYQDVELILRIGKSKVELINIDHIGVIVHWEEGFNARIDSYLSDGLENYNAYFINKYKHYFTIKAYKNFILKHIIPIYLLRNKRLDAIKLFLKEKLINNITIKIFIKLIIKFIVGNNLMIRNVIKKFYQKTHDDFKNKFMY